MQLRISRLCLDCEEVHDAQHCPQCASGSFVYLTRWIPVAVGAGQPRPPTRGATVDNRPVAKATRPKALRLLRRGAVGLAAIGLSRWLWQQRSATRDRNAAAGVARRSAEMD
jgi:hypothetical protein